MDLFHGGREGTTPRLVDEEGRQHAKARPSFTSRLDQDEFRVGAGE